VVVFFPYGNTSTDYTPHLSESVDFQDKAHLQKERPRDADPASTPDSVRIPGPAF